MAVMIQYMDYGNGLLNVIEFVIDYDIGTELKPLSPDDHAGVHMGGLYSPFYVVA